MNDLGSRDLHERVREFIRTFGLLNQDRTPCGRPLPTSQAHSLQVLGLEGPVCQRTLAARLHLNESTVSRLAEQLVERGWAEKHVNAENRREMLLTLTERGQAVLADVTAASDRKFSAIWSRIPAHQQAQVLTALDTLIVAVSEH
ncbi:MAG TPA: MarR family transcriptional regulator [Chloroflexota bacterium]